MKKTRLPSLILILISLSLISSDTLIYYPNKNCTGSNTTTPIQPGCTTLSFSSGTSLYYNGTRIYTMNLLRSLTKWKFMIQLYGYINQCPADNRNAIYVSFGECLNIDNGSILITDYSVFWSVFIRLMLLYVVEGEAVHDS
eukprot:TRINITY_DN1203_c0_g1_i2.p1 TRINITY_DN1203_c0_g1~~TRINITY_DN1203_c0_g1_i2.p1  ORF type:complete len:154 (-),score=14.57 TRINITY_DN1203_c0_g1_i2:231-653(-)